MGIVVMTKLTEPSANKLHKFVSKFPLDHLIKLEYYHVTLAYDKAFDETKYEPSRKVNGAVAYPLMWDVFNKDGDEPVLVLRLQSPDLEERHEELKKLGVKHGFDSYKPHITVAVVKKDFDISTLKIPVFELTISHEYVKELDPKYSYKPKTMCEGELASFGEQLQNEMMFKA